MRKVVSQNYRRISKAKARKLYEAGNVIMVIPCKVHPDAYWLVGLTTNPNDCELWTFENMLNAYNFYHCNNAKLGKYPAFYEIKEN